MDQITNLFEFSHVVKIYVPGTIDENTPALELQKEWTAKTVQFMADLFGGCTYGSFTGAWKNDAGQIVIEPQNICYSFFDGSMEKVCALAEYAKTLCAGMRQTCISIEFDGRLGFISADSE